MKKIILNAEDYKLMLKIDFENNEIHVKFLFKLKNEIYFRHKELFNVHIPLFLYKTDYAFEKLSIFNSLIFNYGLTDEENLIILNILKKIFLNTKKLDKDSKSKSISITKRFRPTKERIIELLNFKDYYAGITYFKTKKLKNKKGVKITLKNKINSFIQNKEITIYKKLDSDKCVKINDKDILKVLQKSGVDVNFIKNHINLSDDNKYDFKENFIITDQIFNKKLIKNIDDSYDTFLSIVIDMKNKAIVIHGIDRYKVLGETVPIAFPIAKFIFINNKMYSSKTEVFDEYLAFKEKIKNIENINTKELFDGKTFVDKTKIKPVYSFTNKEYYIFE